MFARARRKCWPEGEFGGARDTVREVSKSWIGEAAVYGLRTFRRGKTRAFRDR
jgi:hypothetical protein